MTHFRFLTSKQWLAISACGFAALVPARADEPAVEKSTTVAVASTDVVPEPGTMVAAVTPASSPDASSSPTLAPSGPVLRPVEMPDGSLASPTTESNPTPDSSAPSAPAPTEMSATSPAMTPPALPTPDPSAPLPAAASDASASPVSQNVTINLINLMVKRKLISQDDASDLIKQAEQEAVSAQAAAKSAQTQTASATAAPADDDTVHVAYVPDVVKNQIRDEVKADVMKQAESEHWSSADTTPDWVHRFHVTGDIRTRYEGDLFPDDNSPGQLVNFNSINTGSPFDINPLTQKSGLIPTYNVDENRNRFRLRARIGAGIDLGENFYAGMRIGTGSDDSPVSENQTLGSASGQGGNFSKYQIWLDRGFIRYEIGGQQDKDFSVTFGRFDNPFFNTNMLWADDLAFDGFMAQGKYQVADGVTPFAVAGAFPVFNTDLNFGTNSTVAGNGYESSDKWLFAGQTGATWIINKDFTFKGAVGYFDFENIQGQVSSPVSQDVFSSLGTNFNGDTDDSRPSFAQHGNTYIALRNIVPDPALGGSIPEYQYFGLASRFQELTITGQLDYSHFDPFHIWLIGEFVDNVAFDKSGIEGEGPSVLPGPLNNNNGDSYAGGGQGYDIRLNLGAPSLQKLWDWNVNLTYRYLESDAVVDAFNDSDFGGYLAGTNLKGFIVGGNLALSQRVWTSLRFLEADSIAGPPLKTDTIQVDLNAKF
jgi:Putative porin